ncbi:MAG TPA: hypothetical protein EYG70_09520 [Sulfurimonas sp.]|nr:hypothetical protein [Sulfurimonas sp.]
MNLGYHSTDSLTSLLIDSNLNHEPLTLERLHKWHTSLFIGGYSSLLKDIDVGKFRTYDDMETLLEYINITLKTYI